MTPPSTMFRPTLALAFLLPTIAVADDEVAPVFGPEPPPADAPVAPDARSRVAPLPAPAIVMPAPAVVLPARPADLQRRWGVSARAVSLTLAKTEAGGEVTTTEYGGGGIAASYRINRRWEVVLSLDTLDAPQGPDLHSTAISARFHLTPHRRWDWYVMAGVGMLHEAPVEGEERADDQGRGRFHAGVGLARRWRKWSLAAELHSVGVGPKEQADPMATAHATTPPTVMSTDKGLSGGELTLAATFFF